MISLVRMEISAFFGSLTAYIVIGIFLLITGLMMWVFPAYSILDYEFASMEPLFTVGPAVLLFLVPAVTMRSFAEEKAQGTLEFLLTKPLRREEIVLGKYISALLLLVFALLPTLVYYYSVYRLGSPVGNIDSGATIGSYLGLFLLAASFAAIGLFASSVSPNQVVSFLLSLFLGFLLYWGIGFVAEMEMLAGRGDYLLSYLSMDFHYASMSRGLLDSRDIVYFLSIIIFFLYITALRLKQAGSYTHITRILLLAAILLAANSASSVWYAAVDMTEDKRFTIGRSTERVVDRVDEDIRVYLFLTGKLPAGFRRLQEESEDMLRRFNRINPSITFDIEDLSAGSVEEVNARRKELAGAGIVPASVRVFEGDEMSEKLVYPYAVFTAGPKQYAVNLLESGDMGGDDQLTLDQSVSLLEYKFADALRKLLSTTKPLVLFTEGQGELADRYTADVRRSLSPFYRFARIQPDSLGWIPPECEVLVVAKPRQPFSSPARFAIDQYIMNGGKVLWLIDHIGVSVDSIGRHGSFLPLPLQLGLEDLFFKYGFRLETNLVQDLECARIPLASSSGSGFELYPWYYHPLAIPSSSHPATRGLDRVNLFFPSQLDTVRTQTPVQKEIILTSSARSRTQGMPVPVDFNILRYQAESSEFGKGNIPLGLSLEGEFPSAFENRLSASFRSRLESVGAEYRARSPRTRMVVIADGDVIRNSYRASDGKMLPAGYNRYDNVQFDNRQLMINLIEYLADEEGILSARTRNFKLRLLDPVKVREGKAKWQLLNVLAPLLFLVLFGILFTFIRRRRYTHTHAKENYDS